jgi:membrane associated rhomboid family serine protease
VKTLILVNIGVFILQMLINQLANPIIIQVITDNEGIREIGRQFAINRFDSWFALIPRWVTTQLRVWQLVSYMFLHGSFLHILFNMLFLWFFGSELERYWGSRQFTRFYFICGIGAGLFHMLFSFTSIIPVVGASGAVFGVMTAYAILWPNRIVTLLLFFVLPVQIKVKYLVMFLIASNVLSGFFNLFGNQSGVAHFAHLGGALVGYLLLRKGLPLERVKEYGQKKMWERRVAAEAKRKEEIRRLRNEVDALLDKINEIGYDNLTDKEKKLLKDASQYLSKE